MMEPPAWRYGGGLQLPLKELRRVMRKKMKMPYSVAWNPPHDKAPASPNDGWTPTAVLRWRVLATPGESAILEQMWVYPDGDTFWREIPMWKPPVS